MPNMPDDSEGARELAGRICPAAPARSYSARGAVANACFVVPEWNLVIARLAAAPDDSKASDQTWNTFFSKLGLAT